MIKLDALCTENANSQINLSLNIKKRKNTEKKNLDKITSLLLNKNNDQRYTRQTFRTQKRESQTTQILNGLQENKIAQGSEIKEQKYQL